MPPRRAKTAPPVWDSLHLRSLSLRPVLPGLSNEFPFNLSVIRNLETLQFNNPVTFFVGENGSGKSTLLEALAFAAGLAAVGSERLETDSSLEHARRLGDHLRLAWQKRSRRGFFLRAEDFFGYARRMAQVRAGLQQDLQTVEQEYRDRPAASQLASLPYRRELGDLQRRYGSGLDNASHGESFLALFQARFVPNGLYLLDEPEAPLSPLRQLALIAALQQMVARQAQFIIATHSPILMAFPGATILNFDDGLIHPLPYDQLEHVTITRAFLNDPQAFLRHLEHPA